MTSRKFLVTGIAGFMGSHIADALIEKGYEVVGIDNLVGGYKENVPSQVDFLQADLNHLDSIKNFFRGVDTVVHTACTAYEGLSVFSPNLVTRNTFQITASTLTASIQNNVRKFVNMSSMARYGTQETIPFSEEMVPNPQDPYGIAKYASELLLKNCSETHGMAQVTVVPHNIIGPRQKYDDPYRNVASIMINRMIQGKQPIIYGSGEQKRCFSFMSDVVKPIVAVCETEVVDGLVVNIGPDEEFITINKLAEKIASILDFSLDPIYLPERPREVLNANCSAELARRLLNYETKTTLEEGLSQLVEWIKLKGAKKFNYHLPIEIITTSTPKTWTTDILNN